MIVIYSQLLTIVLALAPTQSPTAEPTAAPSQSPTHPESDTCDWVALRSDECPSDNGKSLDDCHENMAVGELCEADRTLPNGKYFVNIDNCDGYDVFRFECGRRPTGAPTAAPTAEPTGAPTQSPTNPRSEVVCDGSYGTYDCVCEDSRVKLATLAPRLVRLNGRRKMAIQGEEAYCEGANTCMFEQEVEPGFTGGISNYQECVHLKSWETYDVMSYFPSDGDQLPKDASTDSCMDYFFECAVSAGGYVNLGTGTCRAENGGYFDRYYGFGTRYECEDLCAANIECLGYAISESNPDKCHLYVPDDVTFSNGPPSGFTYSHTSHDGTYITGRYITGAFSGDFALGCMKKPADPTKEPTANPTNQPTKVPTSKPSRCPTRTPSAKPMSPPCSPHQPPHLQILQLLQMTRRLLHRALPRVWRHQCSPVSMKRHRLPLPPRAFSSLL